MTEPALGVVFRPQSPPERLREVAVAAEGAGVDELWLWEDCFLEGGLTSAAAALAWTERLRVGVGLLPVPLRNPALTAMEIATLARLFPGRFVAGLGHGVRNWMVQVGAGVAAPMSLLREYTAAVRDLLNGRTVVADGRFVRLDGVALDWPPEHVPPLLLGARGPKTLRLAGELADGVILEPDVTPDGVRAARALVNEGGANRRGRCHVVVYTEVDVRSADLESQVADRVRAFGAAGVDAVVFQGTAEDPGPEPLIAACAASRR